MFTDARQNARAPGRDLPQGASFAAATYRGDKAANRFAGGAASLKPAHGDCRAGIWRLTPQQAIEPFYPPRKGQGRYAMEVILPCA